MSNPGVATPREQGVWTKLRNVLEMIKFSHSIFSVPFALCGAWLAARGVPEAWRLALILVCAVCARSAAMGMNRLADREIDGRNPRTRGRALPAGLLAPGFVWCFVAANSAVFILCAGLLSPLCLALSPLVLLVLLGYSWMKRVTNWVHLVLGLALGLAPMGAWLAIRGQFDSEVVVPLALGLLVLTWVSGFDIIYACQDREIDQRDGLHSIPARFGLARALQISSCLHVLTAVAACAFLFLASLTFVSGIGVALMIVLLFAQHQMVSADDLSRVNVAFFSVNGWVGIVFFIAVALDLALYG